MKKIIALLLALIMVMGLATVVSADEAPAGNAKIYKEYTVTGSDTLFPAEELTFTVAADNANPDTSKLITVGTNNKFTVTTAAKTEIPVTLPTYEKVGTYKYTITETAANNQGVGYDSDPINVTVYVTYGENQALETQLVLSPVTGNANKKDTFANTYGVGSLSVKKVVSGDLASRDQLFDITIKLNATNNVKSAITVSGGSDAGNAETIAAGWTGEKEITIKLKHDETVTVEGIPASVTYTVDEADVHATPDTSNGSDTSKGYTVTGEVATADGATIAANDADSVTITNTKNTNVQTGIVMDSVPFIVMAVIAVLGVVAITAKKRVQE